MIFCVYVNGVYKGCVYGDTKMEAANEACEKFNIKISDKMVLVYVEFK